MRKRRHQRTPPAATEMGQEMLIREVAFAPGAVQGDPLLLMRCKVDVHSELPQQTITIGIRAVDVDAFLIAVQQGVATYKKIQAERGQ